MCEESVCVYVCLLTFLSDAIFLCFSIWFCFFLLFVCLVLVVVAGMDFHTSFLTAKFT